MAWTWSYEGPDGTAVGAVDVEHPDFPTQADAESWIGEVWRDLRQAGVHAVSLEEDGRHVYGPMGLDPT